MSVLTLAPPPPPGPWRLLYWMRVLSSSSCGPPQPACRAHSCTSSRWACWPPTAAWAPAPRCWSAACRCAGLDLVGWRLLRLLLLLLWRHFTLHAACLATHNESYLIELQAVATDLPEVSEAVLHVQVGLMGRVWFAQSCAAHRHGLFSRCLARLQLSVCSANVWFPPRHVHPGACPAVSNLAACTLSHPAQVNNEAAIKFYSRFGFEVGETIAGCAGSWGGAFGSDAPPVRAWRVS